MKRFDLTGKTAIVTGGAQGIGKGCVEALLEAGARVCIFDINKTTAHETCDRLTQAGFHVLYKQVDVNRSEQVTIALEAVLKEWGKIDIAVNNVGIGVNESAETTSEEVWRDILDTNLTAMFLFAQSVGRIMLRQKKGVIVNTASMSSIIIPHPQKQAAYNTSKAGVVQLTKSLASEWGGRGVRVNCISPGIVETPLINTDALRPLKTEWIKQNPMNRLASVEDLKGSIIYLVSDASSYVNGHNLVVDGGHTLW
jgi:NAD(P)-dependent dehydrogenase (short-subunit alcohol dehydrogenase family)